MRIAFDKCNRPWLVFKEFRGRESRVPRDCVIGVADHGDQTLLVVGDDRNIYVDAPYQDVIATLFPEPK